VPEVRRVIFISTPQHGSYVAGSWVGDLAARLITLPIGLTSALADTLKGNTDALRMKRGVGGFNSVWGMTPDNPALQAFAATPIAPGVAAHSIVAVQGDGPIETGDDGVVTYKSAHIDGVQSEFIVRSGHSSQANPRTIAEVHRILLLHLVQACPTGCPPTASTDGRPFASAPTGQQQSALVVSHAGGPAR
jgi:hypothetical protein